MRILLGCEESQAVCKEFRYLGHEAYSCDTQACSGGRPEWHIQGNVLDTLWEKWDLAIFFPPCTHLAVSGAKHFHDKRKVLIEALLFVRKLMRAPIPMIAIENPVSIISTRIRKPDQIIQPYMFGHTERKTTCLWLKNLPLLKETKNVKEEMLKLPYKEYAKVHSMPPGKDRAKLRSKTFTGIAKAMATQWSEYAQSKPQYF